MSYAPWIKIEVTLPDKPEVIAMAAFLRIKDSDLVTGKLIRLWAWADANSVDGHRLSVHRAFIDRLTACRGFAAAMEEVGWLTGKDGLLSFPGFDRHNGDSAKKRAGEARKKDKQRKGKGDNPAADTGTNVPHQSGQTGGPEEEEELGERERGRGDSEKPSRPPADPLAALVLSLRPEWQAAPALSDEEAAALAKNRAAIAAIEPATWEIMRRFMAHRFPEGDARWQPSKRLAAIRSLGDIAAQAAAWDHGTGGSKPAAGKPWPAEFETWARDRYSSLPARAAWMAASIRAEWEARERGDAA